MQIIKVLILRPHIYDPGGVAYYYYLVEKYFSSKKVVLNYFYTGKNPGTTLYLYRFFKTLVDLTKMLFIITKYDLIVLNPSLDPKAIIRDGTFHFIFKYIFHKSTLIFFHGWKSETEKIIEKNFKKLFRFIFNFDKACVLSNTIKRVLIRWDFLPSKIIIETTAFEGYKQETDKDPLKVIFISRFVKQKGCVEALKALEIVCKNKQNVMLFMVGNGEMEEKLKKYVKDRRLDKNVTFTGYLKGKKKYDLLDSCGIMLFPTYTEGMPISLLECLAMGIVVITRPVGGIPDIFKNGENGFLIDSLNPYDFAVKLNFLLENKKDWANMSYNNTKMAMNRFEIKKVVKRLETLFYETAQHAP